MLALIALLVLPPAVIGDGTGQWHEIVVDGDRPDYRYRCEDPPVRRCFAKLAAYALLTRR
jgi:hypothetical protein